MGFYRQKMFFEKKKEVASGGENWLQEEEAFIKQDWDHRQAG